MKYFPILTKSLIYIFTAGINFYLDVVKLMSPDKAASTE